MQSADLGEQDRNVGGGDPKGGQGAGRLGVAVVVADNTEVDEDGRGVRGVRLWASGVLLAVGDGRPAGGVAVRRHRVVSFAGWVSSV